MTDTTKAVATGNVLPDAMTHPRLVQLAGVKSTPDQKQYQSKSEIPYTSSKLGLQNKSLGSETAKPIKPISGSTQFDSSSLTPEQKQYHQMRISASSQQNIGKSDLSTTGQGKIDWDSFIKNAEGEIRKEGIEKFLSVLPDSINKEEIRLRLEKQIGNESYRYSGVGSEGSLSYGVCDAISQKLYGIPYKDLDPSSKGFIRNGLKPENQQLSMRIAHKNWYDMSPSELQAVYNYVDAQKTGYVGSKVQSPKNIDLPYTPKVDIENDTVGGYKYDNTTGEWVVVDKKEAAKYDKYIAGLKTSHAADIKYSAQIQDDYKKALAGSKDPSLVKIVQIGGKEVIVDYNKPNAGLTTTQLEQWAAEQVGVDTKGVVTSYGGRTPIVLDPTGKIKNPILDTKTNKVTLSTGEVISKTVFDEVGKIGKNAQIQLNNLGTKGFNDYVTKQSADFKDAEMTLKPYIDSGKVVVTVLADGSKQYSFDKLTKSDLNDPDLQKALQTFFTDTSVKDITNAISQNSAINTLVKYGAATQNADGTYNISLVNLTSKDISDHPELHDAIITISPTVNPDSIGKIIVTTEQWKTLQSKRDAAQEIIDLAKDEKTKEQLTKAFSSALSATNENYFVVKEISLEEYNNKLKNLIFVEGYDTTEAKQKMTAYRPYTSAAVYSGIDPTYAASIGLTPKLSTLEKITPWQEELGEKGSPAKYFAVGAGFIIPGITTALAWDKMSTGGKALSIGLDVATFLPVDRPFMAAKEAFSASETARLSLTGKAFLKEAVAAIKSPVTMILHPIGTIKSTYATTADMITDILDPRKLPEAVVTTSNRTIKMRITNKMGAEEAKSIRDEITRIAKESGEDVAVEITNKEGQGLRITLPRSPLMKEVGGGVTHATPFAEAWEKQIEEKGFASVLKVATEDGKGLFVSPEPLVRFAKSTATGEFGEKKAIMIWGKKSPVSQMSEVSGKTFGETVEMERVIAPGTIIWEESPAQVLYTRIGPEREICEIWLDTPLTTKQIMKLKSLKLIETVKAPFKPPIKFERIGEYGLEDGLKESQVDELAKMLGNTGNDEVARNLRSGYREYVAAARVGEAGYEAPRILNIDRVERIEPQIQRVLEPVSALRSTKDEDIDRVFREDDTIRVASETDTDRVFRETETSRIAREPELTRITRTPDTTRITREVEPPRITRTEEPPRLYKPPERPPVAPTLKGKDGKPLTEEQRLGSMAWKQGIMYKLWYPPFGQDDIINSRKPFPGVQNYKGFKSAYKSLIRRTPGIIPPEISRSMGMFTTVIKGGDKAGAQPQLVYKEHEERKRKGKMRPSLVKI